MLTARTAVKSIRSLHPERFYARALSSKPPPPPASKPAPTGAVAQKKDADKDEISPVAIRRQEMSEYDRHMVWGTTGEFMPAPVLPEKPEEISLLDPADMGHRYHPDGTERVVVIRQQKKSIRQAPLNPEMSWKIYFNEDGTVSEKWENSLMGWSSNADPYQVDPPLTFDTASDAVYFAKKRGWKYVVQHPILRFARRDGAQYQDNFLPQAIAAKVKLEGTSCDHWHRKEACASHYFRPLKYHGEGPVSQFGPNADAPTAPHKKGIYKMRWIIAQ